MAVRPLALHMTRVTTRTLFATDQQNHNRIKCNTNFYSSRVIPWQKYSFNTKYSITTVGSKMHLCLIAKKTPSGW